MKLNPTREANLALLASCLWPFLNLVNYNKSQLEVEYVLVLLSVPVLLFVCGIGALRLLGRFSRRDETPRFTFALAIAVALFFNYHAIYDVLAALALPRINYAYLTLSTLLLLAALRFFNPAVIRVSLVFFVVAGAIPAFEAMKYRSGGTASSAQMNARPLSPLSPETRKRDVYYFILDSYGRQDLLQEAYDFDNSSFIEALEQRGFYVAAQALANYPSTFLSVSSGLVGEYLLGDGDEFQDMLQFADLMRGNNPMIRRLKLSGYKYVHAQGHLYTICVGYEDWCIDPYQQLLSSRDLLDVIVQTTPIRRFWRPIVRGSAVPLSYLQARLAAILEAEKGPLAVFAHILPPHSPWTVTADCRPRDDPALAWSESTKQHFLDSLTCVNTQLTQFVGFLDSADPEAIVVIQSDHGTNSLLAADSAVKRWTAEQFEERFAILMAVRVPEQCRKWLYPSMSPVDVPALVFACLEGKQPVYRPYQSFLVEVPTDKEPGRVKRYRRAAR